MAKLSSATDARSATPPLPLRAPLLWLVLPLIAGYLVAELGNASTAAALPAACLACGIAFFALRGNRWLHRTALLAAILIASFAWKALRTESVPPVWENLPPREVTVLLKIDRAFENQRYPGYWRGLARIVESDPFAPELEGFRVLFSTRASTATESIKPADQLRLRGVLSRHEMRGEAFDRVLKAENVHFRLEQGHPLAYIPGDPGLFASLILPLRQRLEAALTTAPSHLREEAGVVAAMLLGDRSLLAPVHQERFLLGGVMHLFAVSGLHIMLLALLLQETLRLARLGPGARTAAVLGSLLVYLAVIGFPASAVRAYSMLVFFFGGRVFFRRSSPFAAVVASALFWLILQPSLLHDLGFQLSYLVISAIFLLGLPLGTYLSERTAPTDPLLSLKEIRRRKRWNVLRERGAQSFAVSLTACTASAPLILQHFEVISPGAIWLNLLLIPLTGLIVAFGGLIGATALLGLGGLSQFLAHGAWLVVLLMDSLTETAVALPGAFFHAQWRLSSLGTLVACGFLLGLLWLHTRRQPLTPWRPTMLASPFLGVFATLLLGAAPLPAENVAPLRKSTTFDSMKSAYELAMERLAASDPDAVQTVTDAQRAAFAKIEEKYRAKIAEREVFLQKQIADARRSDRSAVSSLEKQLRNERARLESEMESAKEKVRRGEA